MCYHQQHLIRLSFTEEEIIVPSLCTQELLWITQIYDPIIKLPNSAVD
jgi:hypothetical protein